MEEKLPEKLPEKFLKILEEKGVTLDDIRNEYEQNKDKLEKYRKLMEKYHKHVKEESK